jgi:phosphopantothenoylcysteine decarboxylase/phosphopantothenate--cysteine ligase
MGADVTVITGPAEADLPEGVAVERVLTSSEMADALHARFREADVCIMAAAISDFRPRSYAGKKMPRLDKDILSLELVPSRDIAAELAGKKKSQFLVCFSLETGDDEKRAAEKMKKKGCDMMVLNSVASSLGTEKTRVSILYPGEPPRKIKNMSKRECARIILTGIAERLGLYNG